MTNKDFYKNLNTIDLPLTEVFQHNNFSDVPDDWFVILADVKDSTGAVNSGKHNDVNLIAAGSLIVVLNIAKRHNIEIPFFFGGDGGTMLVPEELLNDTIAGLVLHNNNAIKSFGLKMHIGSMRMKDILGAGHFVKISKVKYDAAFNKPVIIGDGLRYAEHFIKEHEKSKIINEDSGELNLTGLECRWDKIKAPGKENEIVCYLIEAREPVKQIEVYRELLLKTEEIYGNEQMRSPLSLERLKLLLTFDKFKKEMLAKYGTWKLNYLIASFFKSVIGKFYFKYDLKINNLKGKQYLAQLIANADTLTIDGRISTIISGTVSQRKEFLKYLNEQEKIGNLVYGHHITAESIMTCYIENYNEKHIHFVDGSNGGYTEAAKELKLKIAV